MQSCNKGLYHHADAQMQNKIAWATLIPSLNDRCCIHDTISLMQFFCIRYYSFHNSPQNSIQLMNGMAAGCWAPSRQTVSRDTFSILDRRLLLQCLIHLLRLITGVKIASRHRNQVYIAMTHRTKSRKVGGLGFFPLFYRRKACTETDLNIYPQITQEVYGTAKIWTQSSFQFLTHRLVFLRYKQGEILIKVWE